MNRSLNINAAVMLCVSLMFAYISVNIMLAGDTSGAYGIGFIFGRAIASVLIPLAIVYLPLALFRRGKEKFTKGALPAWWVLFALLSIMSLLGSVFQQTN